MQLLEIAQVPDEHVKSLSLSLFPLLLWVIEPPSGGMSRQGLWDWMSFWSFLFLLSFCNDDKEFILSMFWSSEQVLETKNINWSTKLYYEKM